MPSDIAESHTAFILTDPTVCNPKTFYDRGGGGGESPSVPWSVFGTSATQTQSHTHLTLNHITSKQFWLAEHVNRKRKTPGRVSFPLILFPFISSSAGLCLWNSKWRRVKIDTDLSRPLVIFLVSIEYEYCSNPKEDGSQTRPIKSL